MNTLTARDALNFAGLNDFYDKSREDDDRSDRDRFGYNMRTVARITSFWNYLSAGDCKGARELASKFDWSREEEQDALTYWYQRTNV